MQPKIEIVIFSKDRALQLDSLIRSIRDNTDLSSSRIYILYKSTNSSYQQGYNKLTAMNYLRNISWIKEDSFKGDLTRILEEVQDKSLLMFLVDDNIFHREITTSEITRKFTRRHLFISLRVSTKYAESLPDFININNYLEWKWTDRKNRLNTWGYPFSVDGNIYSAGFIKKTIIKTNFSAPNTLEGNLDKKKSSFFVKTKSRALAPSNPCLFNNPLNKVQSEWETWNASINTDILNEMYLKGKIIDNKTIYKSEPNAPHFFLKPEFKDQE